MIIMTDGQIKMWRHHYLATIHATNRDAHKNTLLVRPRLKVKSYIYNN